MTSPPGIYHAYTNSVADAAATDIVHPSNWLASHAISAGTDITGLAPVGSVIPYSGLIANVPTGYMFCNGSSLLRTGTYADLFAKISTIYGSADGTHFNIPNLVDKFIVGANSDSGSLPKSSITGALVQSYSPAAATLTHSMTVADHTLAHSGFSVANHAQLTHVAIAIADHPSTTQTAAASIAAHGAGNIARTSTAAKTTAPSAAAHATTWPSRAALTHEITQAGTHAALTHVFTQPNAHAGGAVTHSFTPPAAHTLTPIPAFLALAYIVRYA